MILGIPGSESRSQIQELKIGFRILKDTNDGGMQFGKKQKNEEMKRLLLQPSLGHQIIK